MIILLLHQSMEMMSLQNDSMYRKILSFKEVKNAELYVFTKIKYHKESIVSEINHGLES